MQTEDMEQTVDATLTEAEPQREQKQERQKQEGKRPSTAKRMDVDWPLVKRRYQSGESVLQMAKEMGVPANTLYSHIHRHRWAKPERKAVAEVAKPLVQRTIAKETESLVKAEIAQQVPAIAAEARRRLNEWFEAVLRNAQTLQRQIEESSSKRCEVEEIKSLASSLETVDRIARRTFGLDSPSGSPVSVFSVASPAVLCPVIDVETIPEATPASSPQ